MTSSERPVHPFVNCTGRATADVSHNRHQVGGELDGSALLEIRGFGSDLHNLPDLPRATSVRARAASFLLPEDPTVLDMIADELAEAAGTLTRLAEARRKHPEKTVSQLLTKFAQAAEREAQAAECAD